MSSALSASSPCAEISCEIAQPIRGEYASGHQPSSTERLRTPFIAAFIPLVPDASCGTLVGREPARNPDGQHVAIERLSTQVGAGAVGDELEQPRLAREMDTPEVGGVDLACPLPPLLVGGSIEADASAREQVLELGR